MASMTLVLAIHQITQNQTMDQLSNLLLLNYNYH